MNNRLDHFEVFPRNKNFETEITIIDEQHKKTCFTAKRAGCDLARSNQLEINHVFDELAEYANFHYETEEAIWLTYFNDDSWLSSQQLAHASFLPKVLEIKEQNTSKPLTEVIERIVIFLIR